MAYDYIIWVPLLLGCASALQGTLENDDLLEYMSREERDTLREEARDMFYHAYNAYMSNAYPADELMPLSCKGRYRGSEPHRGDMDSTLGNFSLTLVDTLDTLVVLGDVKEFENAVRLVARDVAFDTDVIVSLFETNIRMLGGLLSGHILAEYLQQRSNILSWYRGELLDLARDLGYRFLPAFNTTTGIPYGRINLKHGMKGVPMEVSRETCTACAGSMILEMAALSRLTGEAIFEEKAQKAMDVLWGMRHRGTDLMGSVLNVNSGDWVRRDSGVGAGIDSYYEYCLKAYILLGDEKYLGRFNRHYQAIMKYISQGPMLLDVHMHRPNTNSKNFMDALLAFWPGLQVLKGDIKPAVETHEMLYQVMQRHNFIPEAFTTDFQVHWGYHPLRPEFLESTYYLYRATGDHYYLGVGRKVLKSLQTYARVPCGFAAVSDVRTNKHDDTMDSFVLSETFKYLYLLFAEPTDMILDLDEFIFTTEGHLLPLTLASVRTNVTSAFERDILHVDEFDRTCPNSLHLFPASVRQPLRNMVEDVCPRRAVKRRLSAAQFQANNLEHLKTLSDMGITILTPSDGSVQLLHTFSNAKTPQDAEEGLQFMQEMVELRKSQQSETRTQAVTFIKPKSDPPKKVTLLAGPAHFGPELQDGNKVRGRLMFTNPLNACSDLENQRLLKGRIAIMERGSCMFVEKARRAQKAGAIAGIVVDNTLGSSAATSPMFAMSGDGKEVDDVTIPVVFLFFAEAFELGRAIVDSDGSLIVEIGDFASKDDVKLKAPTDLSMLEKFKMSLKAFLTNQSPSVSGTTSEIEPHDFWMKKMDVTEKDEEERKRLKAAEEEQEEAEAGVLTLEHLNLLGEISPDVLGGKVRITAVSRFFAESKYKFQDISELEQPWKLVKQMYANQIFGKSQTDVSSAATLRLSTLESFYKWMMLSRGADMTFVFNEAKDPRKLVLWFLEEVSQVAPNPDGVNPEELPQYFRRQLLHQYLLAKLDQVMVNLKNVMTKLKKLLWLNPGVSEISKTFLSGVLQVNDYVFLRTLLQDGDYEIQDTREFIPVLNRIHTLVQAIYDRILMNSLRRSYESTGGKVARTPSKNQDVANSEIKLSFMEIYQNLKNHLDDSHLSENRSQLDDFEYLVLFEIQNDLRMKKAKNPEGVFESKMVELKFSNGSSGNGSSGSSSGNEDKVQDDSDALIVERKVDHWTKKHSEKEHQPEGSATTSKRQALLSGLWREVQELYKSNKAGEKKVQEGTAKVVEEEEDHYEKLKVSNWLSETLESDGKRDRSKISSKVEKNESQESTNREKHIDDEL